MLTEEKQGNTSEITSLRAEKTNRIKLFAAYLLLMRTQEKQRLRQAKLNAIRTWKANSVSAKVKPLILTFIDSRDRLQQDVGVELQACLD